MSIAIFLDEVIPYYGEELAPHWIAKRTKKFGSAIVAFRGPCSVKTESMVDMEDRQANERIEAKEMLHFLGEWFDCDLDRAVLRQRLFVAGFAELLGTHMKSSGTITRHGNDLFWIHGPLRKKISVSVVTASPVSTLFHFGVNIDPSGAPVPAIGLPELGIEPTSIAKQMLELWAAEWKSMEKARCKVAPRIS